MKQSKKAFLSLIGGVASAMVLVLIVTRVALSHADIGDMEFNVEAVEEDSLQNFSKVEISGSWDVEIVQGERWKVETNAHRSKGRVSVYVQDGELFLRQKSGFKFWGDNDFDAIARVQMPELQKIDASGGSEVEISGFQGDRLEIDASGAIELEGDNGRYREFVLDASGAVELDFKDVLVTNADVDVSGAAELLLNMDGGELTGSISGAGEILYYGSVSSENVKISGAGEIRHRD